MWKFKITYLKLIKEDPKMTTIIKENNILSILLIENLKLI